MGYTHSPQIILDGLILAMDAASQTSFRGIPTTNLIAGAELSIYNNVPGDVSSVLVPTSETYKGAIVWKQTLTALSANGVSWLSNGNNPGIGTVIWGAGGGLANRYTGHSIFFKPTVPMHSVPIFTCYSNIGGWQSCTNYDDMGDGWFRAYVIWYDTVNRSDGKFWAINPQTATLNTPIDIYWAGPFKEDRNDSQVVAPFVNGTRGTTAATGGGWVDRSGNGNNGELVNGVGFNSSNLGGLVFDGVDDYIDIQHSLISGGDSFTINQWVQADVSETGGTTFGNYPSGTLQIFYGNTFMGMWLDNNSTYVSSPVPFLSTPVMITAIRSDSTTYFYQNGVLLKTGSSSANIGASNFRIGTNTVTTEQFGGKIFVTKIYNRALTQQEILQNYNATKSRYGL